MIIYWLLFSGTENSSNSSTNGDSRSSERSGTGVGRGRGHSKEQKTTRVRTVLNEKQLHTLRTCYGANPRPDALMKEQLTEMTSLSPRVIRVWFQNKRCKDKKRSILMKQLQQQAQDKVGSTTQSDTLYGIDVHKKYTYIPSLSHGTQIHTTD